MNTNSNKLNDIFNKIYCVNLDHRTDKWNSCITEYAKLDINVYRISAIDGSTIKDIPFTVRPGAFGCSMSHLNILKDARLNNYYQVLILEDDARFVEDFNNKLISTLPDVPDDWNMLYLSANNTADLIHITSNVYKAQRLLTTHSYAVNSNLYDVLIQNIEYYMNTKPVDVIYANLMPSNNVYIIKPYLTWQIEGYSDILKRETNTDKWIKDYIDIKNDKSDDIV